MSKTKKLLSLVLAVAVVVTMVSIPAFANASHSVTVPGDTLVYDAATGLPTGTGLPLADGQLALSKIAKATSNPNEFEITLEAIARGGVTPAAVVDIGIVLDASGSMNNNGSYDLCPGETNRSNTACDTHGTSCVNRRDRIAIAAAKEMVEKLYAAGVDTNISISVFSTGAVSAGSLAPTPLLSGKDTIINALNAYNASGMTNIHRGVINARDKLALSDPDKQKFLVVLTDGEANQFVNAAGNDASANSAVGGQAAIDVVNQMKLDPKYAVFGIYLNSDATISSSSTYYSGAYTVREIASDPASEYFVAATSVAALNAVFDKIAEQAIELSGDPITDTMSINGLDFIRFIEDDGNAKIENKIITWTPSDMENGSKIEYLVRLDVEQPGFNLSDSHKLNGGASYTYTYNSEQKTVDFPIPEGKAIAGEVFATGYLVNSSGQYLNIVDGTYAVTTDKNKAVIYSKTDVASNSGQNQWNLSNVDGTNRIVTQTEVDSKLQAIPNPGYLYSSTPTSTVTLSNATREGTFDVLYILDPSVTTNLVDVAYSWSGAPTASDGVTPPNLPSSVTGILKGGSHTVNTSFTNGTVIEKKDALNNITDTWTFGGWSESGTIGPLSTDVTISGTWTHRSFTPDTWDVTYSWTGAPTGTYAQTLPADVFGITNNGSHAVDGLFTSSTVVNRLDEFGNINGEWTFGGWSESGTLTVTGNVAITGEWTFADVAVATHSVSYAWTGEPTAPHTQTLPAGTSGIINGDTYTVDAQFTNGYTVDRLDVFGNVDGRWTFGGWNKTGSQTITGDEVFSGAWRFDPVQVAEHDVTYAWTGDVPTGTYLPAIPADDTGITNGDTHTVDTAYPSGYTVTRYDTFNNPDGVWTFSGWDESGILTVTGDVAITGTWAFQTTTVEQWNVIYDWTNAPTAPHTQILPNGQTGITNGDTHTVDTTYTAGDIVNRLDGFGNINGEWTFSGWDQSGTLTVTQNETVSGNWVFTNITVPTHDVTYAWTGDVPTGTYAQTIPANDLGITNNATHVVDTAFSSSTVINRYDTFGNIDGRWEFSGWSESGTLTLAADVAITGAWTLIPMAVNTWDVTYNWTGNVPTGIYAQTIPADDLGITNGDTHTVDTTYPAGTVVYRYDSSGELDGRWTFNGWDKSGTLTVTGNVAVAGTWTYEDRVNTDYTVKYWIDGVESVADQIVETDFVWENDPKVITLKPFSEDNNKYVGYKYSNTNPAGLVAGQNIATGTVIDVHYVTDNAQTKELSYNVQYYFDGNPHELVPGRTETVWINSLNDIAVSGVDISDDRYEGYAFDGFATGPIPTVVVTGTTISVYYVTRTDLYYTVEYYLDDLDPSNKVASVSKYVVTYGTIVPSSTIEAMVNWYRPADYVLGEIQDPQNSWIINNRNTVIKILYMPSEGTPNVSITHIYEDDGIMGPERGRLDGDEILADEFSRPWYQDHNYVLMNIQVKSTPASIAANAAEIVRLEAQLAELEKALGDLLGFVQTATPGDVPTATPGDYVADPEARKLLEDQIALIKAELAVLKAQAPEIGLNLSGMNVTFTNNSEDSYEIIMSYYRIYSEPGNNGYTDEDYDRQSGSGGGGGGSTQTIPNASVPLTNIPNTTTPLDTILDEDVPKAALPQTGGNAKIGASLIGAVLALAGGMFFSKKDDE